MNPLPLYLTPLPYLIGLVCLWLIGAVVLVLAPGAKQQVGRGLWWVALGWPFTIPMGVLIAYVEWRLDMRRTRTRLRQWDAVRSTLAASSPRRW